MSNNKDTEVNILDNENQSFKKSMLLYKELKRIEDGSRILDYIIMIHFKNLFKKKSKYFKNEFDKDFQNGLKNTFTQLFKTEIGIKFKRDIIDSFKKGFKNFRKEFKDKFQRNYKDNFREIFSHYLYDHKLELINKYYESKQEFIDKFNAIFIKKSNDLFHNMIQDLCDKILDTIHFAKYDIKSDKEYKHLFNKIFKVNSNKKDYDTSDEEIFKEIFNSSEDVKLKDCNANFQKIFKEIIKEILNNDLEKQEQEQEQYPKAKRQKTTF